MPAAMAGIDRCRRRRRSRRLSRGPMGGGHNSWNLFLKIAYCRPITHLFDIIIDITSGANPGVPDANAAVPRGNASATHGNAAAAHGNAAVINSVCVSYRRCSGQCGATKRPDIAIRRALLNLNAGTSLAQKEQAGARPRQSTMMLCGGSSPAPRGIAPADRGSPWPRHSRETACSVRAYRAPCVRV